jgi:hypothetical protein
VTLTNKEENEESGEYGSPGQWQWVQKVKDGNTSIMKPKRLTVSFYILGCSEVREFSS